MKKFLSISRLLTAFLCGSLLPSFLLAQSWDLHQILGSSDQEAGDNLGFSAAISDSFMLAGAWWEEGDSDGLPSVNSAGAAYLYQLQADGSWKEIQKLISPQRETLGYFGFEADLTDQRAIVSAINEDKGSITSAGAVYVYDRNPASGIWELQARLTAEDAQDGDRLGYDVATVGNYVLAGSFDQDYDEQGGNFLSRAGAAYLFKRQANGDWIQLRKLVAPSRAEDANFGKFLDLDSLGLVIAADHENDPNSLLFESGGAYAAYCNDSLLVWGYDNVTSADLSRFAASDPANFEKFGYDVAISGTWIVAGKSGESDQPGGGISGNTGAAYFFHFEQGQWVEKQKIYAPDFKGGAFFGRKIALHGSACVIAAGTEPTDANGQNQVFGAGAAYVFELRNGVWQAVQKLSGERRGANDLFAEEGMGLWNNHIAIGSWLADSLPDTSLIDGGALYVFQRTAPVAIDVQPELGGILLLNNPSSSGLLQFRFSETYHQPLKLELLTLAGQRVYEQSWLPQGDWLVDASAIPPGVYLAKIHQQGRRSRTWRWVKK